MRRATTTGRSYPQGAPILTERSDNLFELRRAYDLPMSLARLLRALIDHRYVSRDMIEHELKLAGDGMVAIHRLRRRVSQFNIKIEIMREQGYWLQQDTKTKILRTIGEIGDEKAVA